MVAAVLAVSAVATCTGMTKTVATLMVLCTHFPVDSTTLTPALTFAAEAMVPTTALFVYLLPSLLLSIDTEESVRRCLE